MSHLNHINEYKKALLAAGIDCPMDQQALVRAAYISALIRLISSKAVPAIDRKDVIFNSLNQWNEIFPVNGNLVYGQVTGFYDRLNSALCLGCDVFVKLSSEEAVSEHPSYSDVEGYQELVQCLFNEAETHYNLLPR